MNASSKQAISAEGNAIIAYMLRELSNCKYFYRSTAEGCYVVAIKNCHMPDCEESMGVIVDEFFRIMNEVHNEQDI